MTWIATQRHLKIAHGFNRGFQVATNPSPGGTKEIFCRPCRDLANLRAKNPSVKTLGYFRICLWRRWPSARTGRTGIWLDNRQGWGYGRKNEAAEKFEG